MKKERSEEWLEKYWKDVIREAQERNRENQAPTSTRKRKAVEERKVL